MPTAILDFQDGRHHNIINTNISASKKLLITILGLKIHLQGQLCHLPKCQMVNYLEKRELFFDYKH